MYRYIISFSLVLLLLSSCKKEEDMADFYCKVNGEKWVVYNSAIGGSTVEASIDNYYQKQLNFTVSPASKDEGFLAYISINVQPFSGNKIYNIQEFVVSASAKNAENSYGYHTEYEIDTTQAATFTILENDKNSIKGSFDFTLKTRGSNQGNFQERLVVTEGKFQCDLENY
jgi:hypothetical protein